MAAQGKPLPFHEQQELTALVHTISHRVAGFLERQGILERDEENSYLNLEEGDEDPMQQVLGCSVSYRIAIGPQQGRKVFTLQTIPSWEEDDRFAQVAKESGFSLHAGEVLWPLGLAPPKDTAAFTGQGGIATTAGIAACYAGLARFRLVCIAAPVSPPHTTHLGN